ncbi:Panacea domain-containing protein [Acidithiobacillus marinus]|nr:Panacea domain-containing protein [Acidithiobacillus marinus]
MKLMYLAERASYQQFGAPLVGDSLYSLPHGPVMSTTLSLINSVAEEREGGDYWDSLIAERTDGKYMCLREGKIKSTEDLLYLSEADCEILEKVWSDFGGLSAIKLRAYTHDPDNCPEWEDPNGSSRPISLDTMLTSMGYSPDAIEIICNNIAQMAATNASLKPQVRF